MSWGSDITDNVIKLGTAIGICDTTEIRKLKEANEKSKLEAEMKIREDEVVKQNAKAIKEMDELMPSYNAVMLYASLKTGDLNALKEFLKPKETVKNPKVGESKFENVRTNPKPAEPAPANTEGLAS